MNNGVWRQGGRLALDEAFNLVFAGGLIPLSQVVVELCFEPELWGGVERFAQFKGHIYGNGVISFDNGIKVLAGNPQGFRHFGDGELVRLDVTCFKNLTGMIGARLLGHVYVFWGANVRGWTATKVKIFVTGMVT
jgi:hypothetical protein